MGGPGLEPVLASVRKEGLMWKTITDNTSGCLLYVTYYSKDLTWLTGLTFRTARRHDDHHSHFTDEETKTPRGYVTRPRLLSQQVVTHGWEAIWSGSGLGTYSDYTRVPIRTLPHSKPTAVPAVLGAPKWAREGFVVPRQGPDED